MCTRLRNEATYLPEWIEFHLKAGATQVTIQIQSRRATMMLVTTGSEEKTRREIRDEARARNGALLAPELKSAIPLASGA